MVRVKEDIQSYVNLCSKSQASEQRFDIAEIVITNLFFREGVCKSTTSPPTSFEIHHDLDCVLRLKLGHWSALSTSDIALELFDNKLLSEDGSVIWSGSFDGPAEGVCGLAHLASLKFLTLRLVPGTPRVRVEILKRAFEACDSLLDDTRQVWKKSMVHVMSWLRPEVMTSEARYGTRFNDVTEAETTDTSKQPRFDAAGFYEAIKPSKMDPMLEDGLTDLLPELRPYQQRAAYWMVQRERGEDSITLGDNHYISPMSISVGFLDSASKMFFNPFSGNISLAPECLSLEIPGGILADEMGLGKTVELLACIFVHRKQDKGIRVQCDMCNARQHADRVGKGKCKKAEKVSQKKSKEYFCKNCPVSTGATLIVCPAPILKQWESEIKRHTRSGSLVTCTYGGVRKASLSCEPTFDSTELLNADIVLTTYDVLRQDLAYVCDNGDRRCLRFEKRYPFVHTPLTKIFWWRICLDEAQMVENNTSAAAEMALRLYTKHRWCITGTPIQRKLDDLFGLLKFLKASPFDVSRWWTEVIRDPYERRDAKAMEFTHKFFKQVMWRSSKVHVADELQLPPQDECVSWLEFSAIERYYYSRQHDTCVSYAREVIETMKNDILKRGHSSSDNHLVTHAEAGKLLNSLLKLRQACCHPQVGGDAICSLQQTPMTMEEILMVLVDKTRNEGVKALGMLNLALNKLGSIAVFKQNISEALSLYKEALAITEEHAEDFPVDLLLNIHILQNLVETRPLVESYSGNGSASGSSNHRAAKRKRKMTTQKKDGEYLEECKTLDMLKVKYLSAFNSKLSAAQHEFTKSNNLVSESLSDMGKQHSGWWVDALQIAEQSEDISCRLTRKIEEAIHGSLDNSSSSRATSRFRTIHGTKLHLRTCMDTLQSSRETLLSKLLEIDQTMEKPKLGDIERIGNCKYCQKKDGPMCVHCELDQLFKGYEGRLSEIVLVLRVIRKHCKTYLNDESQLAAKKHLQTLKVRNKECAHASLLASAQANLLLAYDNIKIRQYASKVDKLEADIEKNTKQKFSAQSSLRSNKGKLRYLKGLMKSKQDECPICRDEFVRSEKSVFPCGHITCFDCCFELAERESVDGETRQKQVMCPICRQHTDVKDICFADDRPKCSSSYQEHKENEASLAVKGSYGTKVEAVTRRILWIKSSDPQAKVLVFSSWNDNLDVLQHAFAANGITFIRMKGGRESETAISEFKGTKSIQVLLLLVQHGANGLNLLEAKHVILVEPLINPAAEAQAVGRVHRIGQEKPTMVHRFLVTGTVEESISKLNKSRNTNLCSFTSRTTKNHDQQGLTLRDLESVFASPAEDTEETPGR